LNGILEPDMDQRIPMDKLVSHQWIALEISKINANISAQKYKQRNKPKSLLIFDHEIKYFFLFFFFN
jgi:hypothetical protein